MLQRMLFFNLLLLHGFGGFVALAQEATVRGTVYHRETREPLAGVSVKVVGKTQASKTDTNGTFMLQALPAEAQLSFSMVGFVTQQLPAKSNMEVFLVSEMQALAEVEIVSDGYRTSTRAANASAITSIGGEAFENKPFSTFMQSLQGQSAGVTAVQASGQPGSDVAIRIRGLGSLSLSSNPLIVVDGMIVNAGVLSSYANSSSALAGINQNDIARMDVLKDAAATALYGSRGSNGVILITTKRGNTGKTQVRLDAELGVSSPMDPPEAGKPLSATHYAELFRETLSNGGYAPEQIETLAESYGLNSGLSNHWYDLVTRTGRQQQYNVSLNGGSDKAKIFASAGYFDQEATTIGSDFKKISGLFNYDYRINDRLYLSTGINFSNVDQNTPNGTQYSDNPVWAARMLRPYQLAYNADGSLNTEVSGNTNFPGVYNPLWIAAHDKKHLSETRILGNTQLKWNIWDKLNYTSYFSIDYNTVEETIFLNGTMGLGASVGGYGRNYYRRYFNWLSRNQLDYRYDIPGFSDFYVTASVGYEAQRSKEYYLAALGYGFPSGHEDLTALSNAATPAAIVGQYSNYAFTSLYATGGINYQNKYALNLSWRRDGSSRFPTNNQQANFYSIGGTWNVETEDFFKRQNVFSSWKIRSSYGTTGNANLGNYDWLPQSSYSGNYGYAGYNGQQYNIIGSRNLRWETAKKFDVGADIGFAEDRFVLTVDYYYNNIDGLIQSVPTSLTTGFASASQNIGAMVNKGWEFTVKGDVLRVGNFKWFSNFNVSFNQNVMKRTANAAGPSGLYYLGEGYNFYTYYMKEFAGVDPANGDPLYYVDASHAETTNNYAEAQFSILDKQSNPKSTGGFNNVFTYKGFSLGLDFNYSFGNWIYGASDLYFTSGAIYTYNKYQFVYNRRWTTPGQVTDVPRFSTTTDYSTSTFRLYSGDYIRLRNVSLGYDFKKLAMFNKLGVSKLHVYARATNLWTILFDDRLPFDPEVSYAGNEYQNMLKYKTFTFGVNIGL